ncbi:MAG: chromate transporter [Mycobacterium leprae]
MLTKLVALAIGFGRATLLGFGGGPSIVPLYEHEAVEVFHWTTKQEFGQTLAFANALPGPIATKLGIYIGYQVAGWPGAVVSLLSITLPTGLALIALFGLLSRFKDSPYLKGMLAGIRPVIFVMLAMLAMDFAKYAFQANGTGPLSWLPFGLAALYFIAVQYLGLSPIWGVIGSLAIGGFLLR